MNWFSLKKPAAPPQSKGRVAPPPAPPVVVVAAKDAAQVAVDSKPIKRLITQIADFPNTQEVMTGVNAVTSAFRVSAEILDYVMVIKTSPTDAVLAYDPTRTQQVKPYLGSLRGAIINAGLRTGNEPLLTASDVLKQVREAYERKQSNTGHSKSDGAKLFRQWVSQASSVGATDIHMSVINGGKGLVQCRVDGELMPVDDDSRGLFTDRDVINAMRSAYEEMADKHSNSEGTFSEQNPRSCMISSGLDVANLRLRFSSSKGFFGPKSVSRLLRSELDVAPMSFTRMGLTHSQIDMLQKAQRLTSGAIIQVGVTGSGKTTAAKTFIETHPLNGGGAFYGIADPIEYLLKNVHQIYIQRDIMTLAEHGKKDPYSEAIEQLLRMDPDLVDIGEVRDIVSSRALASVAKSGHLAMGTLHAPSVAEVINRLTDPRMGFSRDELTSGKLLGFISYQSLVPLLCSCAVDIRTAMQWHDAHDQEHESRYLRTLMQTLDKKFGTPAESYKFKNAEGCPSCRRRGTRGLTMVAEMVMPDGKWLDISAQGNDRAAARYWRNTYSDRRFDSTNMTGKLIAEHALFEAVTNRIDPRHVETWGPIDMLEEIGAA